MGAFVFMIAFFRAANTGITWDEALTYELYVLPNMFDSFFKHQLLNNHILNSLLIRLAGFIAQSKYNELAIRAPSLFSCVIYIFFSYCLSQKSKNRYFVFTLFILNYYLNEFFGLARGYGMACTFITGAIYFFEKWKSCLKNKISDNKSFHLFMLFCSLAVLSNTITLYIVFCFLVIINFKYKKDLFKFSMIFYFFIFLLAALHAIISSRRGGAGVYSSHNFYDCVISIPSMFSNSKYLVLLLSLLFCLMFIYLTIKTKIKNDYLLVFIIFIVVCIIGQLVFHRGFPLMREMIPFYPVCVLIIANALEHLPNGKITKSILAFCIILLSFQFIIKIDTKTTKDWSDNYIIRNNIYSYVVSHDIIHQKSEYQDFIDNYRSTLNGNPVISFYEQKISHFLNYNYNLGE
jgi:hypothetical protein